MLSNCCDRPEIDRYPMVEHLRRANVLIVRAADSKPTHSHYLAARASPYNSEKEMTLMVDLVAIFSDPANIAALATLIAMEVVLGIDNLIFISILTNKLSLLELRETSSPRASPWLCSAALGGPQSWNRRSWPSG
jgi:hypothetical protein